MATTAAQEEFQDFLAKNATSSNGRIHPEDRAAESLESRLRLQDDETEEDRFRAQEIDAAMRMPAFGQAGTVDPDIKLPPASFDSGRATGVKGVIADARNYEQARKTTWKSRVRQARRSVFGIDTNSITSGHRKNESVHSIQDDDDEEESFLQQWRESRRRELESEARGGIRNRRTSPSMRMYGRLDQVDALGYLDAIEKVGRETVVAVFVYDNECEVSEQIEAALRPLVGTYPTVHFVKVHYEDIEFDNAAVPAILAYRNQGDLIANLTGIFEMIPEDEDFSSNSLLKLFKRHNIV